MMYQKIWNLIRKTDRRQTVMVRENQERIVIRFRDRMRTEKYQKNQEMSHRISREQERNQDRMNKGL